MNNIAKVKAKLTKLLALTAESNASPGEIENAVAMASRLMAKHNIEREDLDMDSDNPTANTTFDASISFGLRKNKLRWEMDLCRFVCSFIPSVQYYITPDIPVRRRGMAEADSAGKIRRAVRITFYGPRDDSEAAMELYDELQTVISAMATIRWASYHQFEGAGYAEGFIVGLTEAFDASEEKARLANGETYGLILASNKNALVLRDASSNWLRESKGIELRKTRGLRSGAKGFGDAPRAEGKADGKNYNPSKPTGTKKLN